MVADPQPRRMIAALITAACHLSLAATVGSNAADAAGRETEDELGVIHVAELLPGGGAGPRCFSSRFLALADRDSFINVDRELRAIRLTAEALADHPFIVWAGRGEAALDENRRAVLGQYLRRGGFVLASNTCGDTVWDWSFRALIGRVLPEAEWRAIEADHPLMSSLYEIDRVQTVRVTEQPLVGLYLEDRMVMLYSPVDLRDAANLGPDCCCCGGDDVINARYVNANALVYALTR